MRFCPTESPLVYAGQIPAEMPGDHHDHREQQPESKIEFARHKVITDRFACPHPAQRQYPDCGHDAQHQMVEYHSLQGDAAIGELPGEQTGSDRKKRADRGKDQVELRGSGEYSVLSPPGEQVEQQTDVVEGDRKMDDRGMLSMFGKQERFEAVDE